VQSQNLPSVYYVTFGKSLVSPRTEQVNGVSIAFPGSEKGTLGERT
jgi:hypothetical protein